MRNQYYGDSRDVFKWSVIVRTLRAIKPYRIKAILQVAMLRPDDGSTQGGTLHHPSIVEEPVLRFFEAERKAFQSDPRQRDIRRITRLASRCGGDFEIRVFDAPFPRKTYFQDAIDAIQELRRPALIFLDPDTGIGRANGRQRGKQVREDEVRLIFASLQPLDVLTVFQFKWNRVDWVDHLQGIFQQAVGHDVRIERAVDADLALFSAIRE